MRGAGGWYEFPYTPSTCWKKWFLNQVIPIFTNKRFVHILSWTEKAFGEPSCTGSIGHCNLKNHSFSYAVRKKISRLQSCQVHHHMFDLEENKWTHIYKTTVKSWRKLVPKSQYTLGQIRNGSNISWIYQGSLREYMRLWLKCCEMGRILKNGTGKGT